MCMLDRFTTNTIDDDYDENLYTFEMTMMVAPGLVVDENDLKNAVVDSIDIPIRIIDLCVLCNEKQIAELQLYLVPDELDHDGIREYLATADGEDGDMINELYPVLMHRYYSRNPYLDYEVRENFPLCNTIYCGSIHTLYVNPEYRHKNIGKFLIKRLNNLLAYYGNFNVRCLTTYVNPYHNDIPGNYAFSHDNVISDSDIEMVNRICKMLKKLGFRKIRNSDRMFIIDLFEKYAC